MERLSGALICLLYVISFGMQFKSDHLIRQVIEIQSLELHSLWNFFQTQDCTFHGAVGVSYKNISKGLYFSVRNIFIYFWTSYIYFCFNVLAMVID